MSQDWSEAEVRAAVEDYFDMLREELAGRAYNKTSHRRALMERLNDRSDGSVELKHQNISAVLIEMGVPFIDGYKPRFNYQRSLLPTAVSAYLETHPEMFGQFEADAEMVPATPTVEDILKALVSAPTSDRKERTWVAEAPATCDAAPKNYLELEARNQRLGEAGEQFALRFERARLIHEGRESLADRIEQVSRTVGPSAGYDIRSFEVDGSDRFIEAKTTKYGKSTPFFVTPNELDFSRRSAPAYRLYRIFRFREGPQLFALSGDLSTACHLTPSQFIARPG